MLLCFTRPEFDGLPVMSQCFRVDGTFLKTLLVWARILRINITRLAARRLRRRAGPPSYRVIIRSGICCNLSLITVNHIIQPPPEKLLSFDTPFQGK